MVPLYSPNPHRRCRKGVDQREIDDVPGPVRSLHKSACLRTMDAYFRPVVEPASEVMKFSPQQLRHVGVELDCVHLAGGVPQRQQNTPAATGAKDADTQVPKRILKSEIRSRCDHPLEILEPASVAVK